MPKKIKKKKAIKPARKKTLPKKAVGSPSKKMDMKDVIGQVGSFLAKRGYDPVLTGRACSIVYGAKRSKLSSIEFVIKDYLVEKVVSTMKEAGFTRKDRHVFESRRYPYEIVLYPMPIVVGDDLVESVRSFKTSKGEIKILTPTDSVRQRLSMYYKWGDDEALSEAVGVARHQKIDLKFIERWSEWEWCSNKYREFLNLL